MYEYGRGVGKNYSEAVRWYRKAAAQRHPTAQFNLGIMYQNGQGVGKNYTEAAKWYRKAAEQGNSEANSASATCTSTAKAFQRTIPKR